MLARAVGYVYSEGCRDFYCGGALGFDTFAAKEVILFKLSHPDCRLHLLIPCKNQSERWSAADARIYDYILSNADTVEFVSDEYNDACMKQRNQRLVDLSSTVVAYMSRPYSGAGQTVRMAKAQGKTVYNLFQSLEIEAERNR